MRRAAYPSGRPRGPVLLLTALLSWQPVLTAAGDGDAPSCPQFTFGQTPELLDGDELLLRAGIAELLEGGDGELSGGVTLRHRDRLFSADTLRWRSDEQIVQIDGLSLYRDPRLVVRSQSALFDIDDEQASFFGTDFTLLARNARGEASRIELAGSGEAVLADVRYTTCAAGDAAWRLEAAELRIDPERGVGSARHARLRFAGVPILYAPYFQFPVDDRRRSGLLFPIVGDSDRTGLDLRWPLYLNLAPNYDATLTPRWMSDRGLMLGAEGRWLLHDHVGRALGEYLDRDRSTGEQRGLFRLSHRGRLNRRLALEIDYFNVSDPLYFEDFSGALDAATTTHLTQSATLIYRAPAVYRAELGLIGYQTLPSPFTPAGDVHRRLPYLRIEALTPGSLLHTRAGVRGEYANFVLDGAVDGQRLDLLPYLQFLRDERAWYASSRVDWRLTAYQLSGVGPGQDDSPVRTLPSASAEGGLRFERRTASGLLQTLEPRAMYLYVPFRDQSALPLFDSGEPDFDIAQLFARNRFSGTDRVSDANQLTTVLTTRFVDPADGRVLLSASIGQIYRFAAPQVTLPGESPPDQGGTDLVLRADFRISDAWSGGLDSLYSADRNELNRTGLLLRWRDGRRRVDFGYRYRRDFLEQADLVFATPLTARWSAAGRWRWSLRHGRTLDALAGLSYETCCWSAKVAWRRQVTALADAFQDGLYLQLELKGLGRVGTGFSSLLPQDGPDE